MSDDVYADLLEHRIIFLSGDIDLRMSIDIASKLFYLNLQDNQEDITIYINSHGGSMDALFSIYDVFQTVQSPIKTVCIGQAYSGAAELLAAGSRGKRFALPHSSIMIHNYQICELSGSKTEIEEEVTRLEKMNDLSIELFAKHTGKSIEEIKEDCNVDHYMSAFEAIEYGIIDDIIQPFKL